MMKTPVILLVDDEDSIINSMCGSLEDEGYIVITASDGMKAVEIIQSQPVDIVFLDIWLPEMDGMQTLKAIKKDSHNLALLDIRLPRTDGMKVLEQMKQIDKDLVIIMLTAYADIKDAVRVRKLGAYDYLTNPCDNEELTLTINKALKAQHLSKEVEYLRKRLDEKATDERVPR